MMHSCGYVTDLLPDFIDAVIDALHPIEKAAGNDIADIKKQYGKESNIGREWSNPTFNTRST